MTPYDIREKYAAILAAQPLTAQYIRELDRIYNEYTADAQQAGITDRRLWLLWDNICDTAGDIRKGVTKR